MTFKLRVLCASQRSLRLNLSLWLCVSVVNPLRLASPLALADAKLAGAGEDGVLELGRGFDVDRRIGPLIAVVQALAEHARPDAVRPELLIQYEHIDLEPLIRAFRRRIPVGDDDPAQGIRRGQRHEGHRIEGGAPEIAVDRDRAAGLLLAADIQREQPARAERGIPDSLPYVGVGRIHAARFQPATGDEQRQCARDLAKVSCFGHMRSAPPWLCRSSPVGSWSRQPQRIPTGPARTPRSPFSYE